jgi:hypothetical protein
MGRGECSHQRQLIASSHAGGLGRIGIAADEADQGGLLHMAHLVGSTAELVGDGDCKEAGAQSMPEWLPCAEVGGE